MTLQPCQVEAAGQEGNFPILLLRGLPFDVLVAYVF